MRNFFTIMGALGAAMAIIAGALGAHLLHLEPGTARSHNYDTAVTYLLVHGATVMLTGLLPLRGSLLWESSRLLMVMGMVLFSGGMLVSVGLGLEKPLPVIPAGGMALISGWLIAVLAIARLTKFSGESS